MEMICRYVYRPTRDGANSLSPHVQITNKMRNTKLIGKVLKMPTFFHPKSTTSGCIIEPFSYSPNPQRL